jgi:hypothetical protein
MNAIADRIPHLPTAAPATAVRVAWPAGAREMRLPAKPMRRPDAPALIWRAVMRRIGWRLQRGTAPRPVSRPMWC